MRISSEAVVQPGSGALFSATGPQKHADRVMDCWEILFVRSGYLGIQEDKNDFVVQPGESIILCPGRRHRGTLPFPPDLTLFFVHFQVDDPVARPGGDGLTVPQYTAVTRPDRLSILFRLLLAEQGSALWQSDWPALMMRLILHEIALAPAAARRQPVQPGPQGLADRAAAWIEEHFADGIGAGDAARAMGCHPNYLARVFRQYYGQTMSRFLHEIQISAAKRLLLESMLRIKQVACRCGFNDEGYFRRIFKRLTGVTPKAFRNAHAALPFRPGRSL